MKTYALTGIGPQNTVTGVVPLYTIRPEPFRATPEWLAEQSKYPEMGDKIEVHEDGTVVLVTEAQSLAGVAGLTADEVNAEQPQKKSLGVDDSGNGSENSQGSEKLGSAFKRYPAEEFRTLFIAPAE